MMHRRTVWPWVCLLSALTLVALVFPAAAQTSDGTCPISINEELRKIPELTPDKDGILRTTFTVETKRQCVPVQQGSTYVGQWMDLRTYVYKDATTGKLTWGYPGPTLRVRKPHPPARPLGDGWEILLVNNLGVDGGGKCNSACPAGTDCSGVLPDPAHCGGNNDPRCCCWVDHNQTYPDCFHGDNTTNLHFHGTHVSPQPPQDYVLLELRPRLPADTAASNDHPVHRGGIVAYGEYQYKVERLHETQAEGTHWYHPHKHGSVSLQVGNGMPGSLIIEGAFDHFLNEYYKAQGKSLQEKLLVLQQIQQTTSLFQDKAVAPPSLVNGQVSPTITMRPGEVQRWRFVNATMQVSAQLSIYFPQGSIVKQIAMDGVRFAPENYARQPLFDPSNPSKFSVSPGNRADFLVQAPLAPGTYDLTHEVTTPASERTKQRLRARDEVLAPGPPVAPLVRLKVVAAETQPKEGAPAAASDFPPVSAWPKMPWYLEDIGPEEIKGEQNLTFSMADKQGNPAGPGNPATMFFINNKQFDPDCVDVTTRLNTADRWVVQNTSVLAHPFHIHTNPFQVVSLTQNGTTTALKPPYVWQDTLGLPTGTPQQPGSAELRHRYLQFTGEYVLHCHFLGHEDRGMMFAVQTVCDNKPDSFGKAKPEGAECVENNYIPASPKCTGTSAAPAPASGHNH